MPSIYKGTLRGLYALSVCACLLGLLPEPARAEWGEDPVKKGNQLVRSGKLDEALEIYAKAEKSDPKNPKLQLVYGLTLAQKGQAVEAARHLRAAVQLESTYQGWYSLGLVYANQNAFVEAMEAYQEAIKLNPRAYKTWYQLGLVQAAQGRFKEAIQSYGQAIEMNPQFDDGYIGLGSAYFWFGEREQAKQQVAKMRQLNMLEKAQALETWIRNKESAPAQEPAPEAAAEAPTGQSA